MTIKSNSFISSTGDAPVWESAEAKEQLAQVIRAAEISPQIITRHRKPVVVVLSYERYIESINQLATQNLFESLAGARTISDEEQCSLKVPKRANRRIKFTI